TPHPSVQQHTDIANPPVDINTNGPIFFGNGFHGAAINHRGSVDHILDVIDNSTVLVHSRPYY
ncbi:MAG: hypothetical protein ACI9G1_000331, partial [Pirellulaceae bacterium]